MKGRGLLRGLRLGVDKPGQWWDLVGGEVSVNQGPRGEGVLGPQPEECGW